MWPIEQLYIELGFKHFNFKYTATLVFKLQIKPNFPKKPIFKNSLHTKSAFPALQYTFSKAGFYGKFGFFVIYESDVEI